MKNLTTLFGLLSTKTSLNSSDLDPNTLKGINRPLYVKRVLQDLGWTDFQAAAMCGQFMQESYTDLRCNVWGDQIGRAHV